MPRFQLTLGDDSQAQLRDGVTQMLVDAADETDAKAIAKAKFASGTSDQAWDNATATDVSASEVQAGDANALVDWIFQVKIPDADPPIEVEVVGDATDDTLDEIGAALAVALNADDQIDNASYTGATQTLIVAQGITDALGDKTVEVFVYAPREFGANNEQKNKDVNIPGFVASITDQGVSGDDLTVVFAADTYIVPQVLDSSVIVPL